MPGMVSTVPCRSLVGSSISLSNSRCDPGIRRFGGAILSGSPLRWMMAGIAVVMFPWIAWILAGSGVWNHSPILGYYIDY